MLAECKEVVGEKLFKPFSLTITFDDPDTARKFYTLFNTYKLAGFLAANDLLSVRRAMDPFVGDMDKTGASPEHKHLISILARTA